MSLYDDVDAIKQKNDPVAGWSSGIKLFQSQLQLKKAAQTQVTAPRSCLSSFIQHFESTCYCKMEKKFFLFECHASFNSFFQPKRDQTRRIGGSVLPPVIDLKSKKDDDDIFGSVHSKVWTEFTSTST